MSTILIILVLVLLLGGGGYYGHSMYGGAGLGGVRGLVGWRPADQLILLSAKEHARVICGCMS
jgi:hypothetical protein